MLYYPIYPISPRMDEELEAYALPIPDAFRCPITHEVMEDPVRTLDGQAKFRVFFLHFETKSSEKRETQKKKKKSAKGSKIDESAFRETQSRIDSRERQ